MRKLCIANWKMNMESSDSSSYLNTLLNFDCSSDFVQMVICPPFTLIDSIYNKLSNSIIHIGAQNMSHEKRGPYTGEISSSMLIDLGCKWIILGHSERRISYQETSDIISLKLKLCIDSGLFPILCIGESLEHRKSNETNNILMSQLDNVLSSLAQLNFSLAVAYEPIWAIGTGVNASEEDINSATNFIANHISNKYPSIDCKILYGGSVNKNNSKKISQIAKLDGFLVGSASLDAEEFFGIYKNLEG